MTDLELLAALLEKELTESQREAFEEMADYLELGEGRGLSAKQKEWLQAVGLAQNVIAEETQNLWSSGRVPVGIATKKTEGEKAAARVLANRPLRPPGRSA